MRNICTNRLNLTLPALSVNEGAARAMVSVMNFVLPYIEP